MTIKDFCIIRNSCTGCPFSDACFNIAPESLPPDEDRELTAAIIETGKALNNGHWIKEFDDAEGEVRFYCDKCGKWEYYTSKYCPNCGATMEVEVEGIQK